MTATGLLPRAAAGGMVVANSIPESRRFGSLPDIARAHALLAEINSAGCCHSPRLPAGPLALYGGGDLGRLAKDYCEAVGIAISLVVDRDAERLRADPFWQGFPVASPDEVSEDIKSSTMLAVCVATAPFVPLAEALAADGWHDIVPFYDVAEAYRSVHPLSNGWFADALSSEDLKQTRRVLSGWGDDVSRAHHLQFMAWRLARREWTFDGAPVTRDDRFFIPELSDRLGRVQTFVDGGSYDGRVGEQLASIRGTEGLQVVAIEPDMQNFFAHRARLAASGSRLGEQTVFLPHALDSVARDRPFHDGLGYASQLAVTGSRILHAVTLDSLELAPDYLKLHLEGGELDALKGGIETIRRHRPIIAVTTYHNDDGLWRTPAWLMDELENYRFLMRLHSWCGTGAVVYALPMERA